MTGASSYSGRAIGAELLVRGEQVRTLTRRLTDWLRDEADGLGRRYTSELARNFRGPV